MELGILSFSSKAEFCELSKKNKLRLLFVRQAEPVKLTGMKMASKSLLNWFGFSKF
jgi:hypothetical protein